MVEVKTVSDTRPPPEFGLSAKKLRETGVVAGKRDKVHVEPIPIELQVPTFESLPEGQIDGMIILGYGPVLPSLGSTRDEAGAVVREAKIDPDRARLRHGIIAGVEIVARRKLLKKGALIIISGTATGDPAAFETALNSSNQLKWEAEEKK